MNSRRYQIYTVKLMLGMVLCFLCTGVMSASLTRQYIADISHNFRQVNAFREEVSLNGVWKICLYQEVGDTPPSSGWGYTLVPSSWMHTTNFPIEGTDDFQIGSWDVMGRWKGKPTGDYPVSWYLREFSIPSGWKGQRIILKFGRITMNGTIFLNGKKIGKQGEWDDVEWDITERVKKEGSNLLAVRVDAFLEEDMKFFLGAEMTVEKKVTARLRGITQDVWLKSYPRGVFVSDIFIQPSVRKKELTLQVELSNLAGEKGPLNLHISTCSTHNGSSKYFSPDRVMLTGEKTQVFTWRKPWDAPVLWDMDNPHLYELTVSIVKGNKQIDETIPVRFGFREIWEEGRNVILNGKPVHLIFFNYPFHDSYIDSAAKNVEREINFYGSAGYNAVQIASERSWSRGNHADFYDAILSIADEKGFLVAMPVLPVYRVDWEDIGERKVWQNGVGNLVRKYKNHPSLVFWSMNFNYLGYPWDLNPYAWANNYKPPGSILDLGNKRRRAAESESILCSIDPTRLIYHHAGGNFGEIMTSNFYVNWPPLQELADYPSGWAETGEKPFMMVELGFPCDLDFLRAREGNYEAVRYSEPLEAEYAAVYLGENAFHLQDDTYLRIVTEGATLEKQAGTDKYNINQSYYWSHLLRLHEPVSSLKRYFTPYYIRAWRTYGITGFCPHITRTDLCGRRFYPWHGVQGEYVYPDITAPGHKPRTFHIPEEYDRLSPLGESYREVFMPVLVYVGGSRKEGFSANDHSFFPGEQVEKQIVMVNDIRYSVRADVTWKLIDARAGTIVREGQLQMVVASGTAGFAEFSFPAPDVKKREEFLIQLDVTGIEKAQFSVRHFNIEVFPRNIFTYKGPDILLIDPVGKTKELFDRLKIPYRLSETGKESKKYSAIVIGYNALSQKTSFSSDLTEAVQEGAVLIVFEQSNLDLFGLRLHPRGVRQVFPLAAEHPLISGLDVRDFSYWRGETSLLEPYPKPRSGNDGIYPDEPWRWGNRGVVTSFMIEKPHKGSFKPLLECEFDLMYTPLMETVEKNGRIVFCQMEVTDRYGIDPVATILLERLLEYKPHVDVPKDVIVINKPISTEEKNRLVASVESGATVILLGQTPLEVLSWLPFEVKTEKALYYRARFSGKKSDITDGISTSDLFFKDRREDIVFSPYEGMEILTSPGVIAEKKWGDGQFVFLTVDPASYRELSVSPERKTRTYQKLNRIFSLIIANSGGKLKGFSDMIAGAAQNKEILLPDIWRFSTDPANTGSREGWMNPDFDDSEWKDIRTPGYWENQGTKEDNPNFPDAKRPYDGFAWYRCRVFIPEDMQNKKLSLLLGAVDDMDVTYFNGKQIGRTGRETESYWIAERDYPVPADIIRYGGYNLIAVRVFDEQGFGGIVGSETKIYIKKTDTFPYINKSPLFNPYKLKRW
jgi:beta-galactosidase